MTIQSSKPAVHLSSPGESIAAVPYLLTFTPSESIILLWMNESNQLRLAQRVDLPVTSDEVELAEWRDIVYHHDAARTSDHAVAIVVSADMSAANERVMDLLPPDNATMVQRIFITDFVSWLEHGETETIALSEEDFLSAERLLPGGGWVAPAADRETIEAEFVPERVIAAELIDYVLVAREQAVEEESLEKWHHDVFAGVCVRFLAGNPLSDLEVAELIVSLQDEQARDAFIFAFNQEEVTATVNDFVHLVARTPYDYRTVVATAAGIYAYLHGDGLRANIAVGIALEETPDYQLAIMLSRTISAAIPPSELAALLGGK